MEPNDLQIAAARALDAQKKWRWFASAVPVSLLVGVVLYGTLSSIDIRWNALSNGFVVVIIAGIVLLRSLRRMWLRRYPQNPGAMVLAMMEGRARQFLLIAWVFAAAVALMGMVLFLFAAPRQYPFVFEFIAAVYFALYYPRQRFFDDLLRYQE